MSGIKELWLNNYVLTSFMKISALSEFWTMSRGMKIALLSLSNREENEVLREIRDIWDMRWKNSEHPWRKGWNKTDILRWRFYSSTCFWTRTPEICISVRYEDSKCYLLQSKEIDKGRKRERSHKRFSETEKILSDSNFSETLEHFLLFDSETEAIETVENVWNFFMLRKKIPPKMFCFYL